MTTKGRTILIVAFQLFATFVGVAAFLWGLFAFDMRLGVSGVGLVVALAGLFTDDGEVR